MTHRELAVLASLVAVLRRSPPCGSPEAATGRGDQPGGSCNITAGPEPDHARRRSTRSPRSCPPTIRDAGTLVVGDHRLRLPAAGVPRDRRQDADRQRARHRAAGRRRARPEADLQNTSWENLFVGLDSGKFDAGSSNITVTEERKEKYDFVTYRLDNLAFEARKGDDWTVTEPKDIAGQTDRGQLGHQPGEDPARLEQAGQGGRAGAGDSQVLPERPPTTTWRCSPARSTPTSARTRRRPTTSRSPARPRSSARSPAAAPIAGQDRGHDQEGQRPGQGAARPRWTRVIKNGAATRRSSSAGTSATRRAGVGDQPAGPAPQVTRGALPTPDLRTRRWTGALWTCWGWGPAGPGRSVISRPRDARGVRP